MRNEPLILEAEVVEKKTLPPTEGVAFDHANTVKMVSGPETGNQTNATRAGLREFLKPTVSNLFLLGCLLGLFVLYCCSCVIHAMTLPARRKSS